MIKTSTNYIIIVLLLYMSGSIYAIQIYHQEAVFCFIMLSIIALLIKKQREYNLKSVLTILALSLYIGIVVGTSGDSNINTYFVLWAYLVIAFLLAGDIDLFEFERMYINVICTLAVLSLYSLFIAKVMPEIVWNLPKSVDQSISAYDYYNMGIHVFTIEKCFGKIDFRNNSIFWEAGAAQAFFNLGILFCLRDKAIFRKNVIKILLLGVTVLTTISVTGYLVLAILILMGFFRFAKGKAKYIILVTAIIMSLPIGMILLKTIFGERLQWYIENSDIMLRRIDMHIFLQVIQSFDLRHFMGISFSAYYELYGGSLNSILYYSVSLGIPFVLLIFYSYYNYIKKGFKDGKLLVGLFFVIIFSTEVLLLKPIFLLFIFLVNNHYNQERGLP